jgi:proteic killer suppression protein
MRDLIRHGLLAFVVALGSSLSASVHARDCAAFDRIADLIREAADAQGSARKTWRADGEWKAWESMVVKSLEEAGQAKGAQSIAKSLRRNLQQESRRGVPEGVGVKSGSRAKVVSRALPISDKAEKTLERLQKSNPSIHDSYVKWEQMVKKDGLNKVRTIPGYHDEPLRGGRAGQRSVRMNQQYRVIYEFDADGKMVVIDITPHDYRLK